MGIRAKVWALSLVLPGLLALEPLAAVPSSAAEDPPSGVPALALPEVEAPSPEVPTTPDGTLSVPSDADAALPEVARRSADDLPEPAQEVVSARDAVTEVWENTDGTRTVTIHGEPVNYKPSDSATWEPIDNRLVADAARPGWVRNAANDWTVRFGPVGPGGVGGVEVVTDAGPVRFAPELPAGHAPVAPVVGEGDEVDQVTYPDVWPGVDVRYVVSGGRVKEDIVVRHDGRAAFPFVTEGLGLVEPAAADETESVEVTGGQNDEVAILAPEVVDADGQLARDDAGAAFDVAAPAAADRVVDTRVAGAPQRLTVRVDDGWLGDELDDAEDGDAVVVDPTLVVLDGFFHTAYKSDGFSCTGCGVKVGNSQSGASGAPTYWHTNGGFAYWSSIAGKQVLYAGLKLTRDANPQSSAAQPVTAYWATGDGYGHAVANGNPARVLGTQTIGDVGEFDVTTTVNTWLAGGLQGEGFGFSGAETTCTQPTTGCYTYRSFTAELRLNVNSAPAAPGLVAPADGSLAITSTTPTLKWGTATDPDDDPLTYTAKIATGMDGASGLVATGPASTATTWQVPSGVLRDGVTYYWAVWAGDGHAWTRSAVRKLTVQRAGIASPGDDFAGVSTNLVTGNASITVPGGSLPAVGGGIGVGFSYDSQAPAEGLRGVYRVDQDQDNVIDTGTDPVVLVRDDPQVSFNWTGAAGTGDDAASPSPGVPAERFSVVWTGTVAIPAGIWKLGARADDGVRVYVDGSSTPVVDDWVGGAIPASPTYQSGTVAAGVHEIKIEYFQATTLAGVELWAKDTAPDPDSELVVPASWLSAEPRVLPAGWRLDATDAGAEYRRAEVTEGSVTLFRPDGTAASFPRTAFGLGFAPPKGQGDIVAVNADGTVTVHADSGRTYLFANDGSLLDSTSAVDETGSTAAVPTYDALGRLVTMTDPVSGQDVDLTYAPDDDCQDEPPLLGGDEFATPAGMLCRIDYWDGTTTHLYYKNGLLGYVRNPGDAYWGLSYDTSGRLTGYHDPVTYDAASSGARSDWTELLVELGYDTAGRVTSVTQLPPLQGDPRPEMTYGYAPTVNGNGELTGGTATVTRAGVTGTYRSVAYDGRGRGTSETDAAGLVTTSVWNADDQVVRTDQPGGLRSTTLYDQEEQPVDGYGPAPTAQFNGDGTGQAGVPHEATAYDEGIDGLAVAWWPNVSYSGLPTVHQHDAGTLDSNWGTGSPAGGIPADNFAGRYSGEIVFPAAGAYALRLERDNKLNFYLDDGIRLYEWLNTTAGFSGEVPITSGAAGESHRIRIDFGETTGSAKLKLQWKTPGSGTWVTVPASALRTGYGLVTTTTGVDDVETTTQYADAASGLGIVHGVPVASTTDPGGLALTDTTRYETGGWRRPVAEVMPSGSERTLTYYGDTETRNNPCTSGDDPANQAGRQKLDTAPDPDGGGSGTSLVKETVYDATGRPVANRVGTEPWTCTTYDARGRITEVVHPAFGGSPTRTVIYDYTVDPDGGGPRVTSPLVTSITDPAGTITVETDLDGQPVAQTDVFGNTTTFTYDQAGRPTGSTGPAGTIEYAYGSSDRLTSVERNGQVLANGMTFNTAGQPTGVTYPSGSGNAGNGTSGTFGYDSLGRPSTVTWTGPGSMTITSDAVTRREDGNIIGQIVDGTDHHAGNDFVYDDAGRLSEAWVPGAKYDYDFFQNGFCTAPDSYKNTNRTGMIVTATGGSGVVTNYCYDHADRMTLATDASVGTITYDAHGNTTEIFGETRTYDAADRHLTTTKADTTVSYVRDAMDRIVERKVNGTTTARYGYTGSSDAPSFVANASNAVLEVTFALPGGALLTTRSGGNLWSYSNVHGDVVATANQAGVKQGSTVTYDPYGNVAGGSLPDNSADDFDNGWLGQHQRPLEHEPTLQPVVEMGARQYSPLLGRFLEVDPIVGGSCNAYDYVCAEPLAGFDLTGKGKYQVYFRYGTFFGVPTGSITLYVSRNGTKRFDRFLADYAPGTTAVAALICYGVASLTTGPLAPITGTACGVTLTAIYGGVRTWIKYAANRNQCATIKFSVFRGLRPSWSNGVNCYTTGSDYLWRAAK